VTGPLPRLVRQSHSPPRTRSRATWSVMSDTRHAKEKRDLGYLRDMSWEEDQRTLYHDLITPHRSYAFATPGAVHARAPADPAASAPQEGVKS